MTNVLCSADGHVIEPTDLWSTRLPKNLRDRALRVEHFGHYQDLFVPDGNRFSAGRFRHLDTGELIDDRLSDLAASVTRRLRDLDADGVWGEVIYPNYGMLMFVPDHEVAMAHAQVYNDYLVEAFGAHGDRLVPIAAIPLTNVDDAVAEVERVARMGLRGIMIPTQPPQPYGSNVYDRVWAAAQAHGLPVTFHVGTGFNTEEEQGKSGNFKEAVSKAIMNAGAAAQPSRSSVDPFVLRMLQQNELSAAAQRVVVSLVGSGVLERFPKLHFVGVEFDAYWLASVMASMDSACTLGIGIDDSWEAGIFDHSRPANDQPTMMKAFGMNSRWPYPLRPSEYVRRQVHVTFMHDPTAIALRNVTGVDALLWGADYPHAEGTWPRSHEALEQQFAGVSAADTAAITGGTTARLFGMKAPPQRVAARA
ncbi:MAG: amidohydrolase family protein [Steroidobacteraceae bacterium]